MKKLFTSVAIVLFFGLTLFGKESTKNLTIDMGDVYSKYDKAVESQEKLNDAAKKAQEEINGMLQAGVKIEGEFRKLQEQANSPALSADGKKKVTDQAIEKAKAIEQKRVEITQYQQQATQTLAQRRQSVVNFHLSEIKDVVEQVAKERGADMVFNSTGLVVMYADRKLDITDETITRLNGTSSRPLALPAPKS